VIGLHFASAAQTLSISAALAQARVPPPLDSVRVESPLPGGVAEVVRFLLTTVPSWLQITGIVLAAVVGIAIAWLIITRRRRIGEWLSSRSSAAKISLTAAAALLVIAIAGAGTATWNYTQHSNDFCVGCHVMDPAFEKMTTGKSKHAKLSCHDCHQQSVFASLRQVYVWVSERPKEIGSHANVPNTVCQKCHVTQDTAVWQRIASTAGHRVHLESDSASLRNVTCVKCHGTELHRFEPARKSCGQSGCHDQEDTRIVLAKMAGQTVRHCTTCHQFTADVPALATKDSARGTLVPGAAQCLGCHEMRKVLSDFDEKKDPHGGKCGTCHNPHTQKTPEAAAATCTNSGCHGNWRDEPFHVGEAHRRVGERCLTCHVPHAAKVDASECVACHSRIRSGGMLEPPMPFDTLKALRRSENRTRTEILSGHRVRRGIPVRVAFASAGRAPPLLRYDEIRGMLGAPPAPAFSFGSDPPTGEPAAPDSFPHSRHERLACLECHQTGSGHGLLTFERPRGCQICHHQAPARAKCDRCHQTAEYSSAKQMTATVSVPGHSPRPRPVSFFHSLHLKRACLDCHTTPVTLEPAAAVKACGSCHQDHHNAGKNCLVCHAPVQPKSFHKSLEASHQRCDACHTAATVARLTPTRTFCSTCHTTRLEKHYPQKECTVCHFLADPESYRARISTRAHE
jgi:nitrate/TMAO reductase-like tetraheme cytochrome c subunit